MSLYQSTDLWGRDPFARVVEPYTGKHAGADRFITDADLEYRPRHCNGQGGREHLHNHPGDGGYGKPSAHGVVGGAA